MKLSFLLPFGACMLLLPAMALAQDNSLSDNVENASVVEQNVSNVEADASSADSSNVDNGIDDVVQEDVVSEANVDSSNMDNGLAQSDNSIAEYDVIADEPAVSDGSADKVKSGFSMFVSLGGTYAFYETVSSGFQPFLSEDAGFQGNIDLGYRWDKVGVYFELMGRAAFATKDSLESHCPGTGLMNMESFCFDYKAHKKGEWDGYIGGIGIVVRGLLPITDRFLLTVGGGPLVLLGKAINDVNYEAQFALKLEVGFNFAITDNAAIGVTIAEEGFLASHRSVSPAITFIYNRF